MSNRLKTHTKDAHTVCGGPTQKDVESFRKNGCSDFMKNVYTFMSEVIENRATSKLSNVDLNNHQGKHRCRFRCYSEPSKIPVRSSIRLGNKSRKVR